MEVWLAPRRNVCSIWAELIAEMADACSVTNDLAEEYRKHNFWFGMLVVYKEAHYLLSWCVTVESFAVVSGNGILWQFLGLFHTGGWEEGKNTWLNCGFTTSLLSRPPTGILTLQGCTHAVGCDALLLSCCSDWQVEMPVKLAHQDQCGCNCKPSTWLALLKQSTKVKLAFGNKRKSRKKSIRRCYCHLLMLFFLLFLLLTNGKFMSSGVI